MAQLDGRRNKTRGRHFVQFSLRSLLIVMTVMCIALAGFYHYVEPVLIDRKAVKAIAQNGGSCETIPIGPAFARTLLGDDVLRRIIAVDLSRPEATHAALPLVTRLRYLRQATLAGASFTDEHLASVARLNYLRELTLRGTTVTAQRVANLRSQRPDLELTVEPLEISFENDLRFEEQKGPPRRPFDRSHLTRRIHCLNGSAVQIKGYVFPTLQQFGNRRFLLVRDNLMK